MFQATERQFEDDRMFGKANHPNLPQIPNTKITTFDEIGRANGLDNNAVKYSSELLSLMASGSKHRQDNGKLLNSSYDYYAVAPQGRVEPVILEELILGGGAIKMGSKAVSSANKGLSRVGEELASAVASTEGIALGIVAERELLNLMGRLGHGTRNYLNDTFKVAQEAPLKTTALNGAAAGTASLMGEVHDYTKSNNPKALTKENVLNSGYSVLGDISKALVFGNMRMGASTVGNIAVDKIMTGDGNVEKNVATQGVGEAIDKLLKGNSNPFLRELFIKFGEKEFEEIRGGYNK